MSGQKGRKMQADEPSERRAAPRAGAIGIIRFRAVRGMALLDAEQASLVDFSPGGIGFRCTRSIAPGSAIVIELGETTRPTHLEYHIRRCTPDHARLFRVGAQFQGIFAPNSATAGSGAPTNPENEIEKLRRAILDS